MKTVVYPWSIPELDADAGTAQLGALRAMARGEASERQQKMALDTILNVYCRTHDLSFRPDDAGGERATAFAEGKRFVGLMILRALKQPAERVLPSNEGTTT